MTGVQTCALPILVTTQPSSPPAPCLQPLCSSPHASSPPTPLPSSPSLLSSFPPSLSVSRFSQEDVKSLTAHIVENYWKLLEDVNYVQTFKGLKLRYEQQRERQDNPKLDR